MPHGGSRQGAGRPRKSAEEKALTGTIRPSREASYRARDAERRTLDPCPVPPPPEDLDEHERRWWETLAPAVDEVGFFSSADVHDFRLLVETRALLVRAKSGDVLESAGYDRDGVERVKTVSIAGIVSLTKTAHGLMTTFGLNPPARGKMLAVRPAEAPAEADPDDIQPLKLVTR